jgi:LacI family transcriptional regulator
VQSRKISQAQIARDLGISQGLVSLVLNGRRHGIKATTYERIWQHAHTSGYRAKGMDPSAAASLPLQIGTLFSDSACLSRLNAHGSRILEGIHASISLAGGSPLFLGAADSGGDDRFRSIVPKATFFQGLIIVGDSSHAFLEKLSAHEPRLVSVSPSACAHGHHVCGDEAQSLRLLVQHLRELGHRRIGWLGADARAAAHETRFTAFQTALANAGLSRDDRFETASAHADRADGAEAIHALLPLASGADFPTAFVCYNSLLAAGAVLALRRAGWDVPGQISVVSADCPLRRIAPELAITHAGVCPNALGRAAVSILLEANKTIGSSPVFQRVTLPAELVVGKTSGKAPPAKSRRRSASVA